MDWDDTPKFFGTTKRRGLGRVMIDAVDGGDGFKTKVTMVNGEKLTLRTRGGFPRIYGEMTAMPVTPDPVSFGILQMFMVPKGEPGYTADGVNGYYRLKTGEYILRPYSSDNAVLMFHESASVDGADLVNVSERQFGSIDWFNKFLAEDAHNPAVTWGWRSAGRNGHVPSVSGGWPTHSIYPYNNGIFVDGVMATNSDKFTVLGAGRNAAGKIVAVIVQGLNEPGDLTQPDSATTLISVVQDDAGALDISLGAPVAGWTEVARKVLTPHYAFYQPLLINSSGTTGVTIARQKAHDPAMVTMDLATLTFTSVQHWKWRKLDAVAPSPTLTSVTVPDGPTLQAGYDIGSKSSHYVEEFEQVIAVDYDGDTLVKLTKFSRLDRHLNLVSPMTMKVVPPTFYSLSVVSELEENKSIIAGIVWSSGLSLSTASIESQAKGALQYGLVSLDGGAAGGSFVVSTVRTYSYSGGSILLSDVGVSLINSAFTLARAGNGRREDTQSTVTVGGTETPWVDETTSYGLRIDSGDDIFMSSSVREAKGSDWSGYADGNVVVGLHIEKKDVLVTGPGTAEGQVVSLNRVVVDMVTTPTPVTHTYGTDIVTLATNTLRACDLRHKAFLVKEEGGDTKAFFGSIVLALPPAVTLAEQLAGSGSDMGIVPEPAQELGETISQMTVHQGGTNLVYTDTINDQHTAYHCSAAGGGVPTALTAPATDALFVAPIYFRKSPLEG